MLFMTVYTYKPANRDAVIKRRLEKGPQLPPEVKSVGEWSYTGGGRVFRLMEASDAAAAFKAAIPGAISARSRPIPFSRWTP